MHGRGRAPPLVLPRGRTDQPTTQRAHRLRRAREQSLGGVLRSCVDDPAGRRRTRWTAPGRDAGHRDSREVAVRQRDGQSRRTRRDPRERAALGDRARSGRKSPHPEAPQHMPMNALTCAGHGWHLARGSRAALRCIEIERCAEHTGYHRHSGGHPRLLDAIQEMCPPEVRAHVVPAQHCGAQGRLLFASRTNVAPPRNHLQNEEGPFRGPRPRRIGDSNPRKAPLSAPPPHATTRKRKRAPFGALDRGG